MEISSQTFSSPETRRTFRSYVSMIERCHFDKRQRCYRDMEVCEDWLKSFERFVLDMGFRPEDTTLDRIDNDKGYSPDNCRWATPTEQARNRSNTKLVTYEGKELPLVELCECLDKDYEIVRGRLKIGMGLKEALSKPKRYSWSRVEVDGTRINVNEYCRQHKDSLDAVGLNPQNIRERLRNGWAFQKAVTEPRKAWPAERRRKYKKSKRYS